MDEHLDADPGVNVLRQSLRDSRWLSAKLVAIIVLEALVIIALVLWCLA